MTASLPYAVPELFTMLAKMTFLLLAAWIASLLLRRSSAAVRHFVWASALGGVLLLPVMAFGLPHWNVALPPGPSSRTVAIAMAQPSEVEGRVKAVLAKGKDRSQLSYRRLTLTMIMVGFLLLPLSVLRPVLRAADAQTQLPGDGFKGHPVIVVDPGHGGQDTGAVSAGGVTEKALSLELAQQLRAELEQRGAVVFLTRDGDTFLPIQGRPQFAAQRHADYFVSLHCDVWNNRSDQVTKNLQGTGTVVFFHGQNSKQYRLAQSIGLGIGQATSLPPSKIVSDATRFPTGFGVLRGAQMPAALIECGYMNSPQSLSRLLDPRQQQRLTEGIAAGLVAAQVRALGSAPSTSSLPPLKTAVGFRRYTSPPLPDGSRYTFLYPSYYTKVYPGWLDDHYQFGTVRIDCVGSQPVPWVARPGQTPMLYYANHAPAPHEEFCSVVVGKASDTLWRGKQPLLKENQWIGSYGSHHDAELTDARSRYRFELVHEDRYTPAIFKQTDPVIMQSFRILPPG